MLEWLHGKAKQHWERQAVDKIQLFLGKLEHAYCDHEEDCSCSSDGMGDDQDYLFSALGVSKQEIRYNKILRKQSSSTANPSAEIKEAKLAQLKAKKKRQSFVQQRKCTYKDVEFKDIEVEETIPSQLQLVFLGPP